MSKGSRRDQPDSVLKNSTTSPINIAGPSQFLRGDIGSIGGGDDVFGQNARTVTRPAVKRAKTKPASSHPEPLTDTVQHGRSFQGANLSRQNLRDTRFLKCDMRDADFRGALLLDTAFNGSCLDDAKFVVTDGNGAILPCLQYMSQMGAFRDITGTPRFYTASKIELDPSDCKINPVTGTLDISPVMPKLMRTRKAAVQNGPARVI